MNLSDYVNEELERLNSTRPSNKLNIRYGQTTNVNEIVELYRTYDGEKRKMRPLNEQQVAKHMEKGDVFLGAYENNKLAGVVVSKQISSDYPFFTLPKDEEHGNVYMAGGLYVHKDMQGLGIASKLLKSSINATKNYGMETHGAVGMAYEVSFDNKDSLNISSRFGNFVGFYSDSKNEEGLSVLLYQPFSHDPLQIEQPKIVLSKDEELSKQHLMSAVQHIGSQEAVDGYTNYFSELENGNLISSIITNNTARTIPDTAFEFLL